MKHSLRRRCDLRKKVGAEKRFGKVFVRSLRTWAFWYEGWLLLRRISSNGALRRRCDLRKKVEAAKRFGFFWLASVSFGKWWRWWRRISAKTIMCMPKTTMLDLLLRLQFSYVLYSELFLSESSRASSSSLRL